MSPTRLEELLLLQEEAGLSAAHEDELRRALEGDPELRRALVEHQLLGAEIGRQMTERRLRQQRWPVAAQPGRSTRMLAGSLAVAAVALIVGLGAWRMTGAGRSSPWHEAQLSPVRGAVTLERDGQAAVAVNRPRSVPVGARLTVSADGMAALVRADGARLILGPGAIVGVAAAAGTTLPPALDATNLLAVAAGEVIADVPAQKPEAGPLIMVTARATASTAGGSFRVVAAPDHTRLEVTRGTVTLARSDPDERIEVSAGQSALVEGDRPLARVRQGQPAAPIPQDPAVARLGPAAGRSAGSERFVASARRELAVLQQMPAPILTRLGTVRPDERGLVGHNKNQFECSGYQRLGVQRLVVGLALSQPDLVDDGLRAIEGAFPHQTPEGHFGDGAYCVSYFLCDASHALLLAWGSDLLPALNGRIATLLPKIERAARWLSSPEQVARLDRDDRTMASRLLFDASAFAFSGALLGDRDLMALGAQFAQRGLALERNDGVLPYAGGADSGFQGVALWKLARYTVHFPEPNSEEILRRAGAWTAQRVTADGQLFTLGNTKTGHCAKKEGRCLAVNYEQVTWGLLYYGALVDGGGLDAARRLHARRHPQSIDEEGPPP